MSKVLTPRKAIRAKCLDCSTYSYKDVENCMFEECTLFPHRFGKRPGKGTFEGKIWTPMKAIRHKCVECSLGSYTERELCPVTDCSLHPYRFGKRPERGQPGRATEEGTKIDTRTGVSSEKEHVAAPLLRKTG